MRIAHRRRARRDDARRRAVAADLLMRRRMTTSLQVDTTAPPSRGHVLWITAGLGCDGDTIAITAATQPSIEDIVLGAIPGLPEGASAQPGARLRERRRVPAVVSRRRRRASSTRSCSSSKARSPTRRTRPKATGPAFGTDTATGQPITTCEWIDRLAPKAWAVVAAGTCATYGGIHAMAGQPDRVHGPAPTTSAGTGSRRPACRSSTCPAARCSPTTSWRRCSTCSTRRPATRR